MCWIGDIDVADVIRIALLNFIKNGQEHFRVAPALHFFQHESGRS
ncbi:hypothetical protein NIES2104_14820 [Leptolyngbya sp. NIES-2104]|nr:hypothetical protein NIES2104_14820 [Leptolyngbya sp. NIES-2104]